MRSSELPEDEREGVNQEEDAKESHPPVDLEPVAALDEVAVSSGESAELSDSLGDPSDSAERNAPVAVASKAEAPVDGADASRDLTPNEAVRSSSSDETVSLTPEPGIHVDDDMDEPSADEQSTFESTPSSGDVSGYSLLNSAAASFVSDAGATSSADFADAADNGDGSKSRTVTESTADPWISQMMAIHPRGSSFYGPPDDVAADGDADDPGFVEGAQPESKPFIGPLRGNDGEDPAEQWMRYYQAVHDAARNPRIYSNDGPIPSEDSLALPLALPVTLRHMTPLVEKLIGRAAIEIHQLCEELTKQQIDQFKYELYTEMRALW